MDKITVTTIGRSRWTRVGLLIFVSYFLAFADRSNIGVAAPQMARDLGYDSRIIGTLLSAFFWGYVLTQIPGGWIAQKMGPTRVVGIGMAVTGITACLTGLVDNLNLLLLVRAILGFAEGVVWPAFAILFINWFPGNERSRAVAAALYAMPISAVVMAPLAGWLIDIIHWKAMFVIQGLPALLAGILFLIFVTDDPATDKRISHAEREFILKHREQGTSESGRFLDVLKSPCIWLLGSASLTWIMVIYTFTLWMPTLIKQYIEHGYSLAGSLTAIPFLFGGISMYINARLSDRSKISRGWFVAIPIIVSGFFLLAQHYLTNSLTGSITMFSLAGAGLYSGAGAWWSWAISMFPRNQAGAAIGMMNIFASFGGIVGPAAVGYFAAGSSPANSFYLVSYSLFISAILMLILVAFNRNRQLTESVGVIGH